VARRSSRQAPPASHESASSSSSAPRLLTFVICAAAIASVWQGLLGGSSVVSGSAHEPPLAESSNAAGSGMTDPEVPSAPGTSVSPDDVPSAGEAVATPSPSVPHIGIVAGHWGNDTGAVCDDGLKEVDIDLDVAQQVVSSLASLGYQVDLLHERDPLLTNYRADVLLSIHADSCVEFPNATPPASGFKVASVVGSVVPDAEGKLVDCIATRYGQVTGLYFHKNSITSDMTQYHAFYEINGQTPGAIIETGFMFADRDMLTQHSDLIAQGIVDGILCYLESEGLR